MLLINKMRIKAIENAVFLWDIIQYYVLETSQINVNSEINAMLL